MEMKNTYILFGPPGGGKTYAAERHAAETRAELVFYQCHDWTDADELFVGVNVQAAIAGDAEAVAQPGALLKAAEYSHRGAVVLVIDELDKASERAEALLLDFLQSGRVAIRPGVHVTAKSENITVFVTSNEVRQHSDALLRRCRRVFMNPMRAEDQVRIISEQYPGLPVALIWKAALKVANAEGNSALSVQEGLRLCEELQAADTFSAVVSAYQGWACRTRQGAAKAAKEPLLQAVFGELKKIR